MDYLLRDAAVFLGVSMTTVRRWIKGGKLRAQLRDGVHGPEYVICESELYRVKNSISVHDEIHVENMGLSNEELANHFDQALQSVHASFTKKFEELEGILATSIRQSQILHANLQIAQKTIDYQNSLIEQTANRIVQLQETVQDILQGEIWIANEIKGSLQASQASKPRFFKK